MRPEPPGICRATLKLEIAKRAVNATHGTFRDVDFLNEPGSGHRPATRISNVWLVKPLVFYGCRLELRLPKRRPTALCSSNSSSGCLAGMKPEPMPSRKSHEISRNGYFSMTARLAAKAVFGPSHFNSWNDTEWSSSPAT